MKSFINKKLILAGAALAMGTGVAQAQPTSERFFASGEFEFEYLRSSGSDQGLLYGNFDLGFLPADLGLSVPVSFELGLEGVRINNGGGAIAFYPTVSFHPDFGSIAVGIPRSAVASYIDLPTFAGNRFVDLTEGSLASGGILPFLYLLVGETPFGLRYDGSYDRWSFGGSYHRVDDFNVFAVAARFELNSTIDFTGAIEHFSGGGSSNTSFFLGVESQFTPQLSGGLLLSTVDVFDGETIQGYLVYSPVANLDLTASILRFDSGSSTGTLYGISAEYAFHEGLYGQLGYTDGSSSAFDGMIDLSLGWRFGW